MTYSSFTGGGLEQYKKVSLQSEIEAASPHRLIQMLMEGAIRKIATAKLCIQNSQVAGKGENISTAISIVSCLRASLDKEEGSEIAENLDNLYDYIERRLLEANLRSDVHILDEISGLIGEIKSAWDAISPDLEVKQRTG